MRGYRSSEAHVSMAVNFNLIMSEICFALKIRYSKGLNAVVTGEYFFITD